MSIGMTKTAKRELLAATQPRRRLLFRLPASLEETHGYPEWNLHAAASVSMRRKSSA